MENVVPQNVVSLLDKGPRMFHIIEISLTEGPHDCKNQKIDSASISSDQGESSIRRLPCEGFDFGDKSMN